MPRLILAIDDDVRVLAVIQRRLAAAGFDVTTATGGWEGLRKVRSETPDLIILDLLLPDVSGYQLCAILKGDRVLKQIPVLMLSARAEKRDIDEGMKVGADAYMTKPYDPEELVRQIHALLCRSDEARARQAEPKPGAGSEAPG